MDKVMIKNAFILTMITLVAGIALGVTYEVTKEPIAAANEAAKQAAYTEVFESASSFVLDEEMDLEQANIFLAQNGYENDTLDEIVYAYQGDELLGYVLSVSAGDGYAGNISFSCGITNDGNVNGISILSINETPGLGMKALEDDFKNQFKDVPSTIFEVVKVEPTNDSQIQSISGATYTSKAITGGMNACVAYFTEMLGGQSHE